MRALTLTQPWATMVASGIKRIENRDWRHDPKSMIGQRFAIHASREIDMETVEDIFIDKIYGADVPDLIIGERRSDPVVSARMLFPVSAIIGVATLERCIRKDDGRQSSIFAADAPLHGLPDDQHRWFFGPLGLVLTDIHPLIPIPCKGALSFWQVPDELEIQINQQLSEVTRNVEQSRTP
jgi:hypothetical protein